LKVVPTEKITITERGIKMKVPAILNPEETLTLNILNSDVTKVSNVDNYIGSRNSFLGIDSWAP
jgi:hypothetical protein